MKNHTRFAGVILLLSSAVSVRGAFPCNMEYEHCICHHEEEQLFELSCPKEQQEIFVTYKPDVEAVVRCVGALSNLSMIRDIRVDAGGFLEFIGCPLPQGPIIDSFQMTNSMRVKELSFQSKRNLSETLQTHHFRGLSGVTTLQLQQNGLTKLSSDLFSEMNSLEKLILEDNRIQLTPGLFMSTKKLVRLDLQRNHLISIPIGIFSSLTDLSTLLISENELVNLSSEVFTGLYSLRHLNLGHNRLESLPPDVFQGLVNLKEVLLNHNFFRTLPSSLFSQTKNLIDIDLSYNQNPSMELPDGLFSDLLSLEKISMHHSRLKHISSGVLQRSPNVKSIFLQNNQLTELPQFMCNTTVRLEELIIRYNLIQSLPDGIFSSCKMLKTLDLSHNKITHLSKRTFLGLTNLRKLSMRNNNLHEIHLNTFSEYFTPNLRAVDLANNNLSFVDENDHIKGGVPNFEGSGKRSPLRDCKKLETIDLSNNSIPLIFSDWTDNMANLKLLNLSHNKVKKLKILPFMASNNSEIDVRFNKISEVNDDLFNDASWSSVRRKGDARYYTWHLEGNLLQCSCQNFHVFRFLQDQVNPQILKRDEMRCTDGQFLKNLGASCSRKNDLLWATIVSALTIIGFVTGIFAVYFRYTHEILVWMYARKLCLWCVTEQELDKDKVYDAFVSYSQKDEEFVVKELLPVLEGGSTPFKVCVHYRDWVAGEYIPAQIIRSVESSRRTLVVISPNFVESVWGRMEIRTAHCQALSERRARVVAILLQDVGPLDKLDSELRAYLTMNTYLKWGDPWFWNKLRYALPHRRLRSARKRVVTKTRQLDESNV